MVKIMTTLFFGVVFSAQYVSLGSSQREKLSAVSELLKMINTNPTSKFRAIKKLFIKLIHPEFVTGLWKWLNSKKTIQNWSIWAVQLRNSTICSTRILKQNTVKSTTGSIWTRFSFELARVTTLFDVYSFGLIVEN